MVRTAALLLSAAGCRARPEGPRPDVLLVTVDTLRADHVGAYGGPLGATPRLDALAAEGARWLRAYAAAPLTIPSHATILTGRFPPSHGVRDDGDFVLGEEQVTLAEALRDAGYVTLAFTAAFPTERRWGLAQGFDLYHDRQDVDEAFGEALQRRADDVVDDAISALARTETGRPLFAWVHLFDPHFPYDPPEPWEAEFPGRPYAAEIAFADAELGRLLAAWDERRPREASVVAVTAPNGEALGDGGERTHGFLLTDATLRVPLVLRAPGVVAGTASRDPVSTADLAPTLLALAGVPRHEGLQGLDLREGGSADVYSEALTGQFNLGLAPLYAFTDAAGRYVEGAWGERHALQGDAVALEGTPADPSDAQRLKALRDALGETQAPAASLDPQALRMLSALGYVGGNPTAGPGTLDPRALVDAIPLAWQARRMMSAGMTGKARTALDELDRIVPDAVGVKLLQVQLLVHQGRLDEAEQAANALYDLVPDATSAMQLAALLGTLDRWTEAFAWYERAGEHDPESAEALAGRARALYQLGRPELAEELSYRWLAVHTDHGELSPIRAEILLDDLQPLAAREEVARGLQYEPWSAWARAAHARVLWETGRSHEAVEELEQALALDPYPVAIRMRLAGYLLELGRNVDAVRVLSPVVRLVPDHLEAQALYAHARASLTEDELFERRVDRAHGP